MPTVNISSFTSKRLQFMLAKLDQISDRVGLSVPTIIHLEELRQYPIGTLGRSLADHLDRQQFQPFTTGLRRKQLHDGVHVLTGYDTNLMGELEVQLFLLGTKFCLNHVILGLGILNLMYRHHLPTMDLWKRMSQAYWRGYHSSFDLDTWQPEQQWHLPLMTVQQQFQIQITPAAQKS